MGWQSWSAAGRPGCPGHWCGRHRRRSFGDVTLNEELNRAIVRGVTEELGGADLAQLTSERDDTLVALLRLKADADRLR